MKSFGDERTNNEQSVAEQHLSPLSRLLGLKLETKQIALHEVVSHVAMPIIPIHFGKAIVLALWRNIQTAFSKKTDSRNPNLDTVEACMDCIRLHMRRA